MNVKHIALICQHFYPEMVSTGLTMTELMTGLADQGWSIRVYCGKPTYIEEGQASTRNHNLPLHPQIEICHIPSIGRAKGWLPLRTVNGLGYLFLTTWFLWRDRHQLDGIINSTNPPFIGLAACFFKILTKKQFVTVVYDLYPEVVIRLGLLRESSCLSKLWTRITRFIFRQSSALVVLGRDMEQLVRTNYFSDQNTVVATMEKPVELIQIPNWADERHMHPTLHKENPFRQEHNPTNHFVVQYSGRMGRTHTLEPLIEAAELLQDFPILFQFIGDGAKRDTLVTMAQKRNLQNVQFLPYQPYDRLAEVISAADIAVVCLDPVCTGVSVPSKTYGILACARPILALVDPLSEIGQVVSENECGVVLSSANAEMIAQKVQAWSQDTEFCVLMGQNGHRVFHAKYTKSQAVKAYDELLQRIFLPND